MPEAQAPIEIFCSYAHEDESLLGELKAHLSGLQHQGRISIWYDRQIKVGTNWAQSIDTHLETASLVLLLVSSDFMASHYCYKVEMQRAMQRHEANEVRVIPILVRPVDWQGLPFEQLQVLPTDAKPITSWGNQDEAFADVAAGIRRALDDLSLLEPSAPHAALPTLWNVPYPRNSFFTGRDDVLTRLHTQLQAGQTMALSQPQAISGLGGIGKTQIALEYAYRYHQEYEAVLWASAESQEALLSSYNELAILLNLPERGASEQQIIVQAIKRWLQTHRNWLLILDNADDLDLLPLLLPTPIEGHLLLTTRAWDMRRRAKRIEVGALSDEQGAVFLLRRAGLLAADAELSQAEASEQTLALQLVRKMGGLPLALEQAGAYLEVTGMSLEQYQQVYQRHLLQERKKRVPDHPEPVATTWSLSFARVREKSPVAADLLRLCAYLSPDVIAEEILTEGASALGPTLELTVQDPLLLGQAVEALRAYSLVRRDPKTRTLSVHRLVQAVLQDGMNKKSRKQWAERAVRAVNLAFPDVEHQNWPQCDRLLPHALHCAELIEEYQLIFSETARLLNQTGSYLKERARYQEAERLYELALQISETKLGAEHPSTATSLNNLAGLYESQGRYAEAEPVLKLALQIRETKLGAEHPDTATSLNNLAGLYQVQGKYEQAEPLFRRALSIREQMLGSEHPDTARSYYWLAFIAHQQEHYEAAEPLYRRALSIWEHALGPHHPHTSALRRHYVSLLRAMGRDDEANAVEGTRPSSS